MIEIKAASDFFLDIQNRFSVFLAGSIEMGKAEKWQDKVVKLLEEDDVIVLNPRRDDWDSSWEQTDGDNEFTKQVEWELLAQTYCDLIIMYFDPNTTSPITLLELGLFGATHPQSIVVCCPEGFYRKGNVDVTCRWYGIKQVNSIEELVNEVKGRL